MTSESRSARTPDRLPESEAPAHAAECRTMAELRAQIDRLDRTIVALLAERAGYVRRAARLKPGRDAIVDPARIEDVVAKARRCAMERGLDPELVEPVYRLLIDRFIDLESAEFERLRGAPADAARQL